MAPPAPLDKRARQVKGALLHHGPFRLRASQRRVCLSIQAATMPMADQQAIGALVRDLSQGRDQRSAGGDGSNTATRGAGSGPRPRCRRPAGFPFAFLGRRDEPLMLFFKAMLFGWTGKSGRPPPLEPSLKVQRNIAHDQSSGFAVAPGVKGLNARGHLKVHPNGASRNQRWRPVRWAARLATRGARGGGTHQRACLARRRRRIKVFRKSLLVIARCESEDRHRRSRMRFGVSHERYTHSVMRRARPHGAAFNRTKVNAPSPVFSMLRRSEASSAARERRALNQLILGRVSRRGAQLWVLVPSYLTICGMKATHAGKAGFGTRLSTTLAALTALNYRKVQAGIRGRLRGMAGATASAASTSCAMVQVRSATSMAFAGVVRRASWTRQRL
jgi:hypothetical protein